MPSIVGSLLFVVWLCLCSPGRAAEFVPLQPYRDIDDSRFAEFGFPDTLVVEDFEDGQLNIPGISEVTMESLTSGLASIVEGSSSVAGDLDDGGQTGGLLQATPAACAITFPVQCPSTVSFAFDASLLGRLPTYVGIVWTAAFRADETSRHPWAQFSVVDSQHQIFSTRIHELPLREQLLDQHSDDVLISFINDEGIRRMDLTIVTDGSTRGGYFAVDHLQYGLAAMAGDADLDGDVDFGDFTRLSHAYGQPTNWGGGDFNLNGRADFGDLLRLSANFGNVQWRRNSQVPEPGGATFIVWAVLWRGCRSRPFTR